MTRLIDAEHFKAWILARWEENNPCSEYPLTGKEIIDQIDREKEYPIIDAVPVIRCKDCIHHHGYICDRLYGMQDAFTALDEDYCSRAERSEE